MYDITQKPELTGTLVFRDSTHPDLPKGKKMMIVFGVALVDEDFPIKGEHQVVVRGQVNGQGVALDLEREGTKIPEKCSWQSVDGVLCADIWRA